MERQKIKEIMELEVMKKGFVSPLDVLNQLNLLAPTKFKRWRNGELPCLEKACKADFSTLKEALQEMRQYAQRQKLTPSWSCYKAPGGAMLQFTKRGIPELETLYATHYVDIRRIHAARNALPPQSLTL